MEQMRALYFDQTGEPGSVLQLKKTAIPDPGPNEVRVRVLASPINPSDYYFIQGTYRFKPEYPQTAGLEGVGIVDAAGEGVDLPTGAMAAFLYKEAWADYIIVPQNDLYMLPTGFPVERTCPFILNPLTAWGLLEQSGVRAGDWLLLDAGNSAVARLVTQTAIRRGVKVILVVRDIGYSRELKELGASEVIAFDVDTLPGKILELTEGKGVAAALDSIGGDYATALIKSLAPGGRMIICGRSGTGRGQFDNGDFVYKNISMRGFGIRGWMAGKTHDELEEILRVMAVDFGDPGFRLETAASFPPEEFREALRADLEPGKKGKVVFSFR